MRMGCADCRCVVERGARVIACADEDACCCTHVPLADGAERA